MRVLRTVIVCITLMIATPVLANGPRVGQPAPDFKAVTFDGKRYTLADFRPARHLL
jgi:hypothetical protein